MRRVLPPSSAAARSRLGEMEAFSSLVTLLATRARTQPDERAYIFLSDRGEAEAAITFRGLYDAAQVVAARLTMIAGPRSVRRTSSTTTLRCCPMK